MDTQVGLLLTIGITVVLLSIFLLALKNSRKVPEKVRSEIFKSLDDIKYSMALHNPSANRDGIVRLDALLSKSLQIRFKNTSTCGDNLKNAKAFIPKTLYNDIWHYHKLRNQIVHENIEISNDDAVESFKIYSSVILKLLK